jgi:hypothetical protein
MAKSGWRSGMKSMDLFPQSWHLLSPGRPWRSKGRSWTFRRNSGAKKETVQSDHDPRPHLSVPWVRALRLLTLARVAAEAAPQTPRGLQHFRPEPVTGLVTFTCAILQEEGARQPLSVLKQFHSFLFAFSLFRFSIYPCSS